MPFTLTHTLAVIPVARTAPNLPFAALFIGAMIPDWALFIPIGPHYTTMHTAQGLLTACLPLGLLMWWMFNALYRRALIELAPLPIQARLSRYKPAQYVYSLRHSLLAALAVLIGAASHLLWDAFTHEGRWGVELVPLLDHVFFRVGNSEVTGYKLFQHGSSVIGLPLLAVMAFKWLSTQPVSWELKPLLGPRGRLAMITLLMVVPFIGVAAKMWWALDETLTLSLVHQLLFHYVVNVGLSFFVLFNVYALALSAHRAKGAQATLSIN